MSQAEALLDSINEDEIANYAIDPATEGHIVVGSDRFITVPESLKRIAVQHDHNMETVTFDCPRYWDGIDMSGMVVYINYKCPNDTFGAYLVNKVTIDENDPNIMHFDWTIQNNVTKAKGTLIFSICIKKANSEGVEENHWNSEICSDLYISEGFEATESVPDQYPDIVTQLLARMNAAEAAVAGGAGVMNIEQVFTSADPNGENTLEVTLTDGRMIYFNIRNGFTPVKGTDYWTADDKRDIINSVLSELPRAEAISV